MNRACHLVLPILGAALAAQSTPVFQLNSQNLVSAATSGYGALPNRRGFQFTVPQNITVAAAEICTSNASVPGFHRLELMTDSGGRPSGNQLTRGTWKIDVGAPDRWQGTDFDRPASLLANTPYWLVWNDPGQSSMPQPLSGAVYLPIANYDAITDTWTLPSSLHALPFRLYSGRLDRQGVVQHGEPCAGFLNRIGTLYANQDPTLGNAGFRLEGSGYPGGGLAFLVIGFDPLFQSLYLPGTPISPRTPQGCFLHTEALTTLTGITGLGDVRSAAAAFHVAFPLPVPATPGLHGLLLTTQIVCVDQGNIVDPLPLMTSNGLHITLH